MRMRRRKMMIDRQSLFNLRLVEFIADLNRTLEEAYRSLDEVLDLVEGDADDDDPRDSGLEEATERPADNL